MGEKRVIITGATGLVHAGLYGTAENQNPILENKDIRSMEGR